MTSEQEARKVIDSLLAAAGWVVCDVADANSHASAGVVIREFPLKQGHGYADYLLYVDGKAAGVIEAKKQGTTLTGVETQSDKYAKGLPDGLPCWGRPLPFSYQSTGFETRFTNRLDPSPRSRSVFAFHKPETLRLWLAHATDTKAHSTGDGDAAAGNYAGGTFLARLQDMPPLVTEWGEHKLWPAQITAIRNLEASLAQNKPRALIQMATGSGKTFTAISFIYGSSSTPVPGACCSWWTAATSATRRSRNSGSTPRPTTTSSSPRNTSSSAAPEVRYSKIFGGTP